jgi:hypothetical protein
MNKKRGIRILLIRLLFVGATYAVPTSAADQDIALQYAPILYFVDGEQCFSADVSYAIQNSYLYEIGNPTPLFTAPTAETLKEKRDNHVH